MFACLHCVRSPPVGLTVGASVGPTVGLTVGSPAGPTVGPPTGLTVGPTVGAPVGAAVGPAIGPAVGPAVGAPVGAAVGLTVGSPTGLTGRPLSAAVDCLSLMLFSFSSFGRLGPGPLRLVPLIGWPSSLARSHCS